VKESRNFSSDTKSMRDGGGFRVCGRNFDEIEKEQGFGN